MMKSDGQPRKSWHEGFQLHPQMLFGIETEFSYTFKSHPPSPKEVVWCQELALGFTVATGKIYLGQGLKLKTGMLRAGWSFVFEIGILLSKIFQVLDLWIVFAFGV